MTLIDAMEEDPSLRKELWNYGKVYTVVEYTHKSDKDKRLDRNPIGIVMARVHLGERGYTIDMKDSFYSPKVMFENMATKQFERIDIGHCVFWDDGLEPMPESIGCLIFGYRAQWSNLEKMRFIKKKGKVFWYADYEPFVSE